MATEAQTKAIRKQSFFALRSAKKGTKPAAQCNSEFDALILELRSGGEQNNVFMVKLNFDKKSIAKLIINQSLKHEINQSAKYKNINFVLVLPMNS